MFHRLGWPSPSSSVKWTLPRWVFSSIHLPSVCRFERTSSIASLRRGVDAEGAEQVEGRQRGGPWLALALVVTFGPPAAREARATCPLTVLALQGQQSRAPAFGGDARALLYDDVGRCIRQIAQHLPPDSRVRVEQPVHDGHANSTVSETLASHSYASRMACGAGCAWMLGHPRYCPRCSRDL